MHQHTAIGSATPANPLGRWIELKVAPLAEPNGWFSHWVSVQRDVSEQVEREQRLLASTPLPAASGF